MTTTANTAAASVDQAILDDLITFIRRFVIFQDENQYTVLALWILHTYAFEAATATPYIYVRSAEKQSGKTRTIEVAHELAKSSAMSSDLTASTMFRIIESQRPTMFIDEVDTIFSGAANEQLRGVLNSGYKSNGFVWRTVPGADGGETKAFSTFCPKLLAGIDNGQVPDTILDRSIIFNLKRKKRDQEVERMVARKIGPDVEALKERMQTWAAANLDSITEYDPKDIPEISDRAFEIAEPLLQIASRFKGWTTPARKAVVGLLSAKEEKLSPGTEALLAAKNLLTETKRDRITSAELATALDISPKKLGVLLAKYEITPGTIRLAGGTTAKGYYRKAFVDAWERYL